MSRTLLMAILLVFGISIALFVYTRLPSTSGPASANAPTQNNSKPPHGTQYVDLGQFGYPVGRQVHVLNKDCFVVGYQDQTKEPAWVMYALETEFKPLPIKRDNVFLQDPEAGYASADVEDYRNSGYDRGHMVPAADMKYNAMCFHASFYLSNITPQNHTLNTGLWKRMEEKCRRWSHSDDLVIISGPIFEKVKTRAIGPNRVAIPDSYFKIVFDCQPPKKMLAFYVPNQGIKGNIEKYAVSVDKIEQITGMDFFPKLAASEQEALESSFSLNDWFAH